MPSRKAPKNWPETLPFADRSEGMYANLNLLRSMFQAEEGASTSSDLIAEAKVHPALEIRILEDHPLVSLETSLKHQQRGLFANDFIAADTFLGEYVGEVHLADPELSYPVCFTDYGWSIKQPNLIYIVDAVNRANELALANDYRNIADEANTRGGYQAHGGAGYFGYFTKRDIEPGEEILLDYGEGYWRFESLRAKVRLITGKSRLDKNDAIKLLKKHKFSLDII